MKKVLVLLLLFLLAFNVCFAVEFIDVPKEHWAYEFINKLSNNGVINGFDDGTFKPSETLTKAQFIKLMVSSDKILVQKMNELLLDYDVDRQWYESYFDTAEEYYLLPAGYDINDLNGPISRKDMAEIISNFVKFVSVYNSLDSGEQALLRQEIDKNPEYINNAFSQYLTELDNKLNESFVDVLGLDKKSQENIFIVKDLGIISGYDDGTFKPYNNVTRAEASKVISKYIDETGVGIIISNMLYNEAQDIASNAASQLDALAIQMFNAKFERYAGTKKNKTDTNSFVNLVLSNNADNNISQKISLELVDTSGQSITDGTTINSAIIKSGNTLFDISLIKDSSGYINKAIISANAFINISNENSLKTEQVVSNNTQIVVQNEPAEESKIIIDVPENLTDDSVIRIIFPKEVVENDSCDVSFWYDDRGGVGWGSKNKEAYTIKEIKKELDAKSGEEVMIRASYIKNNDQNKKEIVERKTIVLP